LRRHDPLPRTGLRGAPSGRQRYFLERHSPGAQKPLRRDLSGAVAPDLTQDDGPGRDHLLAK
jgi:hypothetical protein